MEGRVDTKRMEHLRSLFASFCPDEEEVEPRSMIAFSLLIATTSWPQITARAIGRTSWNPR